MNDLHQKHKRHPHGGWLKAGGEGARRLRLRERSRLFCARVPPGCRQDFYHTMTLPIYNRESIASGSRSWHQIEVSGEMRTGDGRTQVTDGAGLASIVREFDARRMKEGGNWTGLLVDHDHLSHDPAHSTEAMGWLVDVEVRRDAEGTPQLYGEIEWTDLGATGIANKRWKFFSTEYDPGGLEDLGMGPEGVRRVRPRQLAGLSLTNRPQRKGGKPIVNRLAVSPGSTEKKTKTHSDMNEIKELLGLASDVSDEDVVAAVKALQEAAAAAELAQAEAEADVVLNRMADCVPEPARPYWRAQLIRNRAEAGKALEASFPVRKRTEAITNRATARTRCLDRWMMWRRAVRRRCNGSGTGRSVAMWMRWRWRGWRSRSCGSEEWSMDNE